MEVQMTEFENAAYVVFVVLLTRVILSFKLNLLLPISKVSPSLLTTYAEWDRYLSNRLMRT